MRTIVALEDVTAGLDASPARPLELAVALAGVGAEALLCSVGLARAVRATGSEQPLAVAVREGDAGGRLFVGPRALARLGLWAIVVPVAIPALREPPRLRALGEVVDFALRAGGAGPLVLADLHTASQEITDRARGTRLACEFGADVVMVSGVASIAEVETVLERAFRPVYLADAFGRANPLEYTHLLKRAAALGVAGVVTGPKLLQGRRPADVVAAVAALVGI